MQRDRVEHSGRVKTDPASLRDRAIRDLKAVGLEAPSERAIESRVRTLMLEEGAEVPLPQGSRQASRKSIRRINTKPMQVLLEQKAQQCAKLRRRKRLEKHVRIMRENTDHFYLFCFLQGGFARFLRRTRGLEVFTAVIENANRDIETWLSFATIAQRTGRTEKTVSKAVRALVGLRIFSLEEARGRELSLSGKTVSKNQGYIIRIHAPMFWDWDSIGGVPKKMKRYLADYDSEPVDNSESTRNGYGDTPVTITTDLCNKETCIYPPHDHLSRLSQQADEQTTIDRPSTQG